MADIITYTNKISILSIFRFNCPTVQRQSRDSSSALTSDGEDGYLAGDAVAAEVYAGHQQQAVVGVELGELGVLPGEARHVAVVKDPRRVAGVPQLPTVQSRDTAPRHPSPTAAENIVTETMSWEARALHSSRTQSRDPAPGGRNPTSAENSQTTLVRTKWRTWRQLRGETRSGFYTGNGMDYMRRTFEFPKNMYLSLILLIKIIIGLLNILFWIIANLFELIPRQREINNVQQGQMLPQAAKRHDKVSGESKTGFKQNNGH